MDVLLDSAVHFPLFCIIDFGGYRIVASACLPLNSYTIVYVSLFNSFRTFDSNHIIQGSNNGGHDVHCSDKEVNDIMTKVGSRLNLKGHYVGSMNKQFLFGPGKILKVCDLK